MLGNFGLDSWIFDPLIGQVDARGEHADFRGAYKVWPENVAAKDDCFRIMVIGNEATSWPDQAWSHALARSLRNKSRGLPIVYNGSGRRSGSPQELLRILRDAPGIRPNMIIALSGAADAAWGYTKRPYPFHLGKPTAVDALVTQSGLANAVNLGYPDDETPAMVWCRNQRLAALAARELGAHLLTILQPVAGLGARSLAEDQRKLFAEFGIRSEHEQDIAHRNMAYFYEYVRFMIESAPEKIGHVVDASELLLDRPETFTGIWTVDAAGLSALGKKISTVVASRWDEFSTRPEPASPPPEVKPRLPAVVESRVPLRTARVMLCRTSGAPTLSGIAESIASDPRIVTRSEYTLCPSSVVAMTQKLDEADFASCDVCVIECSAKEEVALHAGRLSIQTVLNPLLQISDHAGRAGCRVVVVVLPSRNRFRVGKPLCELLTTELRPLGIPVLNLYALLDQAAASRGVEVGSFFDNPLQLSKAVERSIGHFLVEQLVEIAQSSPAKPAGASHLRYCPNRFVGIDEIQATRVAGTIQADQRRSAPAAVRLGDGARLSIAAPIVGRLEGIVIAPHFSGGRLLVGGEEIWRSAAPASPVETQRYHVRAEPIASRPSINSEFDQLVVEASGGESTLGEVTLAGFLVSLSEQACHPVVVASEARHLVVESAADAEVLRGIASSIDEPLPERSPPGGFGPAGDAALPGVREARGPERQGIWRGAWDTVANIIGDSAFPGTGKRNFDRRTAIGDQELSEVETQSIGVFDPLLGQVNARAAHPHYKGGYKIWPGVTDAARAKFKIMTIGNSTSLWPSYPWSLFLGQNLADKGYSVAIYNGAGKGHSSSQEVIRVVRDAPAIKPDLIVALSGICDIGYLVNAKGYPFLHKYSRDLTDLVKATGFAATTNPGYPDPATPAEVWCRNQRLAGVLAAELGINYLTILQPVMGYGKYTRSSGEDAMFRQKAAVVLKSYDRPYGEAVSAFYDEVFERMAAEPKRYAHVVSMVDVFDGQKEVYKDHRHLTELGCRNLADAIEKVVVSRFGAPLARASVKAATGSHPPAIAKPDMRVESAAPRKVAKAKNEDSAKGATPKSSQNAVETVKGGPKARSEPQSPLKIALTGTSNSLLTQGFASAISSDPRVAEFGNYSLGASGTVAVGYHLPAIDFSKYNVCIVDYCVNEEVFLLMGETSIQDTINNMLNLIDTAAKAGCRCMFVVFPSKNRFDRKLPFQQWLTMTLAIRGIPVVDCYKILKTVVDGGTVEASQLFLDNVHLKRGVARVLGKHVVGLAEGILKSPVAARIEDDTLTHQEVAYVPAASLKVSRHARLRERSSRLLTVQVVEAKAGSTFGYSNGTAGQICGLVFDVADSQGRIVLPTTGEVIYESKKQADPLRQGKLTLVAHPLPRPVSYNSDGFDLLVEGRANPADRFNIAGFVIKPSAASSKSSFIPVSPAVMEAIGRPPPALTAEISKAALSE